MAGRWFRFYAKAMRDPKVAKLPDNDFRLWVELMCVASENDGKIPPLDDLKHLLRRRLDHLKGGVKRLISALLIDALEDGYEPHNWSKFQYKSDTSTDRVKRHRSKRNVSVTPPETETEYTVTKVTDAGVDLNKAFWATAVAYLGEPKRSVIGKWVSRYGRPETASAITSAQSTGAVDPVAYIERALRGAKAREDEPIC